MEGKCPLVEQLEFCVRLRKENNPPRDVKFHGNEDLILQHGQRYTAAPHTLQVVPRLCFQRSYQAATRRGSRWIYVEGFALHPDVGMLTLHAWLTREDQPGKAFDVAWEKTDGAIYIGIPFTAEYVREVHSGSKAGWLSVLDAFWLKYPLLTGKHKLEDAVWGGGKYGTGSQRKKTA